MIGLRALALLAFAATPALADGEVTVAQREAYIAAITANGCQMTNAEAEAQLPAAGINKDASKQITKTLVAEGLAELNADENMLILKTEGCAP
jgi:hypothetical protein